MLYSVYFTANIELYGEREIGLCQSHRPGVRKSLLLQPPACSQVQSQGLAVGRCRVARALRDLAASSCSLEMAQPESQTGSGGSLTASLGLQTSGGCQIPSCSRRLPPGARCPLSPLLRPCTPISIVRIPCMFPMLESDSGVSPKRSHTAAQTLVTSGHLGAAPKTQPPAPPAPLAPLARPGHSSDSVQRVPEAECSRRGHGGHGKA